MKPVLVVMAAGMGSRYGGLKQLDPVGPSGETLMDYSIYDAQKAGFGKVVFVIRHSFSKDFNDRVLTKYKDIIDVEVVYQEPDKLPQGFQCPADRVKPWGTNHALMMAEPATQAPFAVINADDFYGRDAFQSICSYLDSLSADQKGDYCMVGYRIENTLSPGGTVSRGVCTVSGEGYLQTVEEHKEIAANASGTITGTANEHTHNIPLGTPVSMNMWGFTLEYFEYSSAQFIEFLTKNIENITSEFYIPTVVDTLIKENKARVKVLDTSAEWFGVTYPTDRPQVVERLQKLTATGVYPSPLFK